MATDKGEGDLMEVLVADSAAFLKNVSLQNIAKNIYTINEVVGEIKSAAVRQRLSVLPYEITFRVPSNDSLHVVSEFAKKTGDFQSLSLVDLKVLALTYQLHKEKCGAGSLRAEPTKQVELVDKSMQGTVPGFYVEKKSNKENVKDGMDTADEEISCNKEPDLAEDLTNCLLSENDPELTECATLKNDENVLNGEQLQTKHASEGQECVEKENENEGGENKKKNSVLSLADAVNNTDQIEEETYLDSCNGQIIDGDLNGSHDSTSNDVCQHGNSDGDVDYHSNSDDSNDEDDGDWITPDNIVQVKADYGITKTQSRPTHIAVGCLTTDFAMQNVLIQMGLHVISVEGMLINEARSYVLKCYSCFKVTTQMQRIFCPKCGNRTLVKVAVSVNEQGVTRYHMPKRNKPFNIRGKKHSLPLPKGGRHSNNPVLFEDQLISQRRLPKAKDKVNVFDEDFVARSSPFAVNDTTSRAFNLGFHVRGQNKRNPNEAKKKTRRKK